MKFIFLIAFSVLSALSFAQINDSLLLKRGNVTDEIKSLTDNNEFLVIARGAIVPSFPSGTTAGSPIYWTLLDSTTDHQSAFFINTTHVAFGQSIQINYPYVKRVSYFSAIPDDELIKTGVMCGVSSGYDKAYIYLTAPVTRNYIFTGNGTDWNNPGNGITASYNSGTGSLILSGLPYQHPVFDDFSTVVQYYGDSSRILRLQYSGMGSHQLGIKLIDPSTKQVVTGPVGTDQRLQLITPTQWIRLVPNNVETSGWQPLVFTQYSAIIVMGIFEVWLKATQVNSTTNLVRWQNDYYSTSNYRVYRSTDSAFTSPTLLITSPTITQYTDTGLTPNTQYWYKLEGYNVSWTKISEWKIKTRKQ